MNAWAIAANPTTLRLPASLPGVPSGSLFQSCSVAGSAASAVTDIAGPKLGICAYAMNLVCHNSNVSCFPSNSGILSPEGPVPGSAIASTAPSRQSLAFRVCSFFSLFSGTVAMIARREQTGLLRSMLELLLALKACHFFFAQNKRTMRLHLATFSLRFFRVSFGCMPTSLNHTLNQIPSH